MALLRAIPGLEAEADLRALQIAGIGANPGEKGREYARYAKALQKQAGLNVVQRKQISTVIPGITPLTMFEAEPGSIEAERQRQKAAAKLLEQQHGQRSTSQTKGTT